jgi:hypothetical protein
MPPGRSHRLAKAHVPESREMSGPLGPDSCLARKTEVWISDFGNLFL